MRKNIIKNTMAILLSIAIIGTGNGICTLSETVYAADSQETNELSATQEEKEVQYKEPTIVKELKSERTENSNTYLMSDGSKQLELYEEDIRFEKDGKLVDYDNSLIENTKDIVVDKKNNCKGR